VPFFTKPRGRISTNVFRQGRDVQRQVNSIASQLGRAGVLNLAPHQVGSNPGFMNNVQLGGPFRHVGGQQFRLLGGRVPTGTNFPSGATVTGNDISGTISSSGTVPQGQVPPNTYGPLKFAQSYGAFVSSQATPQIQLSGTSASLSTFDPTGFTWDPLAGTGSYVPRVDNLSRSFWGIWEIFFGSGTLNYFATTQ